MLCFDLSDKARSFPFRFHQYIATMALRTTREALRQMERLFKEMNYDVRYERGQFEAGACLLNGQRMIVVNKLYTTEGKIQALFDLLQTLPQPEEALSEESQAYWEELFPRKG